MFVGKAVKEGDKEEAEAALKALKDAVNQQLLLARQIAENETDPEKKKELLSAIQGMTLTRAVVTWAEQLIFCFKNSAWGFGGTDRTCS